MKLIAIDWESYLISEEMPIPKPVCLSYYNEEMQGIVAGSCDMEVFLTKILKENYKIIAHNMQFEALVIDEWFPNLKSELRRAFDEKRMICTKIYEQLLNNVAKNQIHKFDLATLVDKYFKEDISEAKSDPMSWRLRYSELDGVPLEKWPQEALDYALDDSIWAYKVYNCQKTKYIDINLSVEADFYLNKMGLSGILVDQERVNTLKQEVLDIINPKYDKLIALDLATRDKKGKVKKKMNNLREYIVKHVKDPLKTIKGNIATDTESLTSYLGILEDTNPVRETIEDFLVIMKYEKILTAFVSRLSKANPYIRTQYKACVSSGRTASSTSKNFPSVNIQQMPRGVDNVTWDIRNCFVPRPGYKICSIDYAGLELSSTANQLYLLTGRSEMLDTINSGDTPVDMHSMFAYRLKNMKEKISISYKEFAANKKKEGYKEYRQLAKPINLGFPGGIGYDTMRGLLAKEGLYPKLVILDSSKFENNLVWKRTKFKKEGYPVRIRRIAIDKYELIYDELVALKEELFALYPDLEEFLKETHTKYLTGETKMLKNEFGEWEKEPMYAYTTHGFSRDYSVYTAVCNGLLMQSPAAIGAKKAMCAIIKKYGDSKNVKPLAFIHDEALIEIPADDSAYKYIEDVSKILIEEMQSVLSHVRITVEAEVCGDYWKKAGGEWCRTYWRDANSKEIKWQD